MTAVKSMPISTVGYIKTGLKSSRIQEFDIVSLSSYATVYTMFPVFSLVLDVDVSADTALVYPELYKDLSKVSKC